ncbi:sigma-E processing peptidase SpoIIGA [Caproiciproducens sp. MSJ-32]|uniref:sigma-E processing peptidase SpoIIGA n=1 Tax=Caproiciproducens sp. MSJ-32 TaxID=2841527 RepID=UPI001C111F50|nr:sigma-E processing peptidase SpoIIGA [Caproiciproducens sp. MSJ-32]MBU5454092.1 sigma-E processing peptidase SpoIIGA [Caproiciproducens sp. MSJ-32]
MRVYIDILIIENFTVNLFLLIITMKLLRYEYNRKIYLSALIGALYTVVIFLENSFLSSMIAKVLIVFIMAIISQRKISLKNTIKMVSVFFIVSFTLSGISFSLSLMDNQYSIFQNFQIRNFSIKYLIISIMLLYIVLNRILDLIKERTLIKNFIYDIEISDDKNVIYLKGLLDTGNGLREPVTNLPCIIIENDFIKLLDLNKNQKYFISYNTITEKGSLQGFKSKKIRIRGKNSEWINVEAIICASKNKLSKENEFNALLSRGVI